MFNWSEREEYPFPTSKGLEIVVRRVWLIRNIIKDIAYAVVLCAVVYMTYLLANL